MAGKIDFRYYGDALCCCISNYLADLVLRVPHAFAVRCMVVVLAGVDMTDDGLLSDRADFCQFRVLLDLDSPALVVGEMPVECIELMYLHDVDISLYCVHAEEMSCLIEVETAVSEAWGIVYRRAWHGPVCLRNCSLAEYLCRKHLLHGLDRVDHTVEG